MTRPTDRVILSAWPRLLSVDMVAKYLGIAPQTVRNHRGDMPGRRMLGGHVVYDRVVLDKWIEDNSGRTDLWIDAGRLL